LCGGVAVGCFEWSVEQREPSVCDVAMGPDLFLLHFVPYTS
jgi:hypothetical protein